MWAAVSTVTDARDKACAPAFGQGHQRIVDSSALFTQSLFLSPFFYPIFSLLLSSSLYFFTLQLWFSFPSSLRPSWCRFPSRVRQACLFLKKKEWCSPFSCDLFIRNRYFCFAAGVFGLLRMPGHAGREPEVFHTTAWEVITNGHNLRGEEGT